MTTSIPPRPDDRPRPAAAGSGRLGRHRVSASILATPPEPRRGRRPRRRGPHRRRRPARRPDGQAHRPLAPGQVHRRRALGSRRRSGGARSTGRSAREHYDRLRARLMTYLRGPDLSTPRTASSAPTRRTAAPPRLHRDGLGEHLRPQPVPPPDGGGARRLRPELHDHRRPVVPGRPGDRGHPDRDRDPRQPRARWRSSSSAPSTPARSRSRRSRS